MDISLIAVGSKGSTFAGWTGDIIDTANPLPIILEENTSINANFTLNEYSLSTNALNGTITVSPDQDYYHYGDIVHLTAIPNPDYSFVKWEGDASGHANPLEIIIQGDTVISAHFIQNARILTIASEHGTVATLPDQAVYQDGDVVQLTADAELHYTFDQWTGAVSGLSNSVNVTIAGDTSVTANYLLNEYTLAVISAHGTVTRSPDQPTYHGGDVVQLTVAPESEYDFINWSGAVTGTSNPIDVTIHGNTEISANYALRILDLTIAKTGRGHGTIISDIDGINCGPDCSEIYTIGTTITLHFIPSLGSYFTGWSGGGCSENDTCTFEMQGDITISADFDLIISICR